MTRKELFNAKLKGEDVSLPRPLTRKEQIIAGIDIKPITAEEIALKEKINAKPKEVSEPKAKPKKKSK